MARPIPVVLCILDGWGLRAEREANAVALADTPTYDRIMATCPHATLTTHGPDVGLPKGQMGNSEVGHTNIGAGRVVAMDLGQIDLALEDGSYSEQPALRDFIARMKESGGTAHVMGLISDGGVHGHIAHVKETVRLFAEAGLPVAVHVVTDGRDVPPQSADGFVASLDHDLPEGARIATVTGRYFAMDRDNRWSRVEQAYCAIVEGKGQREAESAEAAVAAAYDSDETDEFIKATVIGDYAGMKPGDGFFCTNFRADRARELLRALADPEFDGFDRGDPPDLAARLGMAEYSSDHNAWYAAVFPKKDLVNTLGEWVSAMGLTQFRVAETEKYPHVTFFLNGGREESFEGEERKMPKSPDVATYDLKPEMSAEEVTDAMVAAIGKPYDLIVVNYANPDMVGHSGIVEAAVAACEAVDRGLGRVVEALEEAGGAMVLCADHGNCELMVDPETGKPHTAHTTNLVPVAVVGAPSGVTGLHDGRLADLAPTVLDLMGIEPPEEMTGRSLLKR